MSNVPYSSESIALFLFVNSESISVECRLPRHNASLIQSQLFSDHPCHKLLLPNYNIVGTEFGMLLLLQRILFSLIDMWGNFFAHTGFQHHNLT